MAAPDLILDLGAGCSARLRWASPGRVELEVRSPTGHTTRRLRGPWTADALRRADAEVRHIAQRALASGHAPALHVETNTYPSTPCARAGLPAARPQARGLDGVGEPASGQSSAAYPTPVPPGATPSTSGPAGGASSNHG